MNASSEAIRADYQRLPSFIQPFLSWLTGKPLTGQIPLVVFGPAFHFLVPFAMVVSGFFLCLYSIEHFSQSTLSFVLPMIWLLMVSGARKLALTVRHQCVHNQFTGNRKLDLWLAEISTTLLCAQDAQTYQHDHFVLHHSTQLLAGPADPHYKVLERYGFKPGMSVNKLWIHLALTLVSPSFHFRYTLDRLKYNFIRPHRTRVLLSILFWSSLISFVLIQSSLLSFFLAYIVPIVFFYNICAILEIISEHPYVAPSTTASQSVKEMLDEKTWGIMCGSPLPPQQPSSLRKMLAWLKWTVKMFGHLLVRCAILPGDLSAHDLHHRKPGKYDWRISIYERQKAIVSGDSSTKNYRDVWGFHHALALVFESYAKSQPVQTLTDFEKAQSKNLSPSYLG